MYATDEYTKIRITLVTSDIAKKQEIIIEIFRYRY